MSHVIFVVPFALDASLRFVTAEDPDTTMARLALVRATAIVIASGLAVFGVTPVEEMR